MIEISEISEQMDLAKKKIRNYKRRNQMLNKKISRNEELILKHKIQIAKWRVPKGNVNYAIVEMRVEVPNTPDHWYTAEIKNTWISCHSELESYFEENDIQYAIIHLKETIPPYDSINSERVLLCSVTEIEKALNRPFDYEIER